MKKLLAAGAIVAATAVNSMAAITVDYAGAVTSAESQVTSAITAGIPVFGSIVAVFLGMKIFKRFIKG